MKPRISFWEQISDTKNFGQVACKWDVYEEEIFRVWNEGADGQKILSRLYTLQGPDGVESLKSQLTKSRNPHSFFPPSSVYYWPEFPIHRIINEGELLGRVGGAYNLLFDLPDFSRSDRRLLVRLLDEIQIYWLNQLNTGAEANPAWKPNWAGPNIVITLQKEIADLAPSFFLGKAHVVEIPPLSPHQLVEVYRTKFGTCAPFSEDSLLLLASLSRGMFRRFLKFICKAVEDGNTERIVLDADVVTQELEGELASIFPRKGPRSKATELVVTLMQQEYGPRSEGRPAGLTQKQAADLIGLEESDVSRIVNRLEANRIVGEKAQHKETYFALRSWIYVPHTAP